MDVNKWTNCYDDGWKDIITPESFAHPAKMAYGLLKRILAHAAAEGWIKQGQVIIDPFGGIFSTGIMGAYGGYQVIGVELEQRFVDLAGENIAKHARKFKALGCPIPVILQGDSRNLCEVVAEADIVVSSPPFQEALTGGGIAKNGYQNEAMRKGVFDLVGKRSYMPENQGRSPGQLLAMKPGQVDTVISSPPYSEGLTQGGGQRTEATNSGAGGDITPRHYGTTDGNLGNLKPGDVSAIISSPPFEGVTSNRPSKNIVQSGLKMVASSMGDGYGESEGQLGNDRGPTFWQAALKIVQQCHQILKPGGHAIWVVKSFVRKGKRVDFPGDWRRLCESVGLKTVCVHHAMLLKPGPSTFWDEPKLGRKHRRSFFKNLSETKAAWKKYWKTLTKKTQAAWLKKAGKKAEEKAFEASGEDEYDWNAHVRIDFEVVLCGVKQ